MDLLYFGDQALLEYFNDRCSQSPEDTLIELEDLLESGEVSVVEARQYKSDLTNHATRSNRMTKRFINTILCFNRAAAIPALRALTHTCTGRTIGAIRQHLRDEADKERTEDETTLGKPSLDIRNEADELARGIADMEEVSEFGSKLKPLVLATVYASIGAVAEHELKSLSPTKWDEAMSFEEMMKYMTEKPRPISSFKVKLLAEAVGIDENMAKQLLIKRDATARDQMRAVAPDIQKIRNGLLIDEDEDMFDALPVVARHQVAVTVVRKLQETHLRTATRIIDTNNVKEMGDLPLMKEGIDKLKELVKEFENAHTAEIREAIDAGANIQTL